MDTLLKILATLALVALNAFFVAAEFAAVGARRSRLVAQERRRFLDNVCLGIKRHLDLYLSASQLGVTLASLGLGAVTEPLLADMLRGPLAMMHIPLRDTTALAFTVALAIATALHIVIGEQAPKTWAIRHADRLLYVVALPLVAFTFTFYPLIWLLNALTHQVLRLSGATVAMERPTDAPHTEGELQALLAESIASGAIPTGKGKLLSSAFDFGSLKVRQIMTPRTQVDFLTLQQPIDQVLRTVQRSAYTRLPLCDGDVDHVIGVIHMKDLFNHLKLVPGKLKFADEKTADGLAIAIATGQPGSAVHVIGAGELDLRRIKREVLFVPELLTAPRLLRQFQTSHVHMAVVVDEYGATRGVVTLEDVLEEIVGEIEDEFDPASPSDFVREGKDIRVSGLYPLHDLRDRIELPEIDFGDVDTIGGYVVQKLNRWPRPGDQVSLGTFTARVLSVQQKRVGQVLISPTDAAPVV